LTYKQIELTGSRLIGAITDLGYIGPKHHGIVIGLHPNDENIYVAENCHNGFKLTTVNNFVKRYSSKSNVCVYANDGEFSNVEVAKRALSEINHGGYGEYNLATNNCETFSNRAMYNKSYSSQIINTVIVFTVLAGAIWYIRKVK